MTRYSVQTRDRIFVTKNMRKNFGKNISKRLSCNYGQKRLDHAKKI